MIFNFTITKKALPLKINMTLKNKWSSAVNFSGLVYIVCIVLMVKIFIHHHSSSDINL